MPLKAKSASRNWSATCERLGDTIRSLRNQSDTHFVAKVVGHECPSNIEWDERISFECVDYEPPSLRVAQEFASDNRRFTLDKNRKIVRGMHSLQCPSIRYWFTLDADDLVHENFVQHVLSQAPNVGMLIEGGFLIYLPQKRFAAASNMVQLCGSTSVLSAAHCQIPRTLEEPDLESLPWCRYSHRDFYQYFHSELGSEPIRIIQPMIGYVLGHGDNCSDGYRAGTLAKIKSTIKPWITGHRIDASFAKQFGLNA